MPLILVLMRGNTSDVQTSAAQFATTFYNSSLQELIYRKMHSKYLQSELSGLDGPDITTWTTANNNEIIGGIMTTHCLVERAGFCHSQHFIFAQTPQRNTPNKSMPEKQERAKC
jgi:hypothetical protein